MTIDARSFSSAAKFPQVHSQEICGVEQYGNLVASGGNDNHVFVYDQRKADMILDTYKHSAAVKAIAWLPRKGVLVTGGGTKDRKLKFWKDGENVYKEVDSGSQVCTLTASKNT